MPNPLRLEEWRFVRREVDPLAFLAELRRGESIGVFIDDSGSPGVDGANGWSEENRPVWVAVVVPPRTCPSVLTELTDILTALREETRATEYHWADILGGRKEFKGLAPARKIGLFNGMTRIFEKVRFPLVLQGMNPDCLKKLRQTLGLSDRFGTFCLEDPRQAALLFLLLRVVNLLTEVHEKAPFPARVFVDGRGWPKGHALVMPGTDGVLVGGQVCFASSRVVEPLQLADFAAFMHNRAEKRRKGVAAKGATTRSIDDALASMYNRIRPLIVTCSKLMLQLEGVPGADRLSEIRPS